MAYTKTTWVNGQAPAINATNLNNIETGIYNNDIGVTTGWNSAGETWEYVSVDDPTGVFRVHADVTTKYSVGMRIKMTNGGNVIYGIITKMGTYGGDVAGYTYVYYLHEIDPTDSLALHLMANSAITANYYSLAKEPFGFPLSETKWRVLVSSTADGLQNNPTGGTWYNLSSVYLDVPIGEFKLEHKAVAQNGTSGSTSVNRVIATTLSTANNSNSNPEFMVQTAVVGNYVRSCHQECQIKVMTAKTRWYINTASDTNVDIIYNLGGGKPTQIIATCNYL
jgi:hypothetical protein